MDKPRKQIRAEEENVEIVLGDFPNLGFGGK
ncbi:MAG: hypothetical protein C5S52_07195 [ANME-2 cluster archaeon]|nr:hypothetical protein [ANME-2 cluster archaeon]